MLLSMTGVGFGIIYMRKYIFFVQTSLFEEHGGQADQEDEPGPVGGNKQLEGPIR